MARAEELVELRLVQADRASGVRADLRVHDEAVGVATLRVRGPVEPDQHGLPVCGAGVALREDGDQTPDGYLVA